MKLYKRPYFYEVELKNVRGRRMGSFAHYKTLGNLERRRFLSIRRIRQGVRAFYVYKRTSCGMPRLLYKIYNKDIL